MSFIPPTSGPSQIQADLAQQRERELEAKAERYAQLHPEGEDQARSAGAIRRALRRLRAAISHRS
jgi:hypothetical protein